MFNWAITGGGILALLCVVGLPIWILGIPGVDNNYARGWKMGLGALLLYLPVYLVLAAYYYFSRNRMAPSGRADWEQRVAVLFFVAGAALLIRIIHAFTVMSRKD